MNEIDHINEKILECLQEDARISIAEISRRVGIAASAIHERLRKLEASGVIRGYEARLEPARLDLRLLAFIYVRAEELPGQMVTGDRLAELENVLEVHHIAGEDCYLLKVRARDPADLGSFLRERIGSIPSVKSTRSTIVLETVKESTRLSLGEAGT